MTRLLKTRLQRYSAVFLQVMIVLVGLIVLAFLLWEPQIEGRNVDATFSQIYFGDAFLAYVYVAAIPFFVALGQAYRVIGLVRRDQVFSPAAVRAFRRLRSCGLCLIGGVAFSVVFLWFGDPEDRPPGVFLRAVVGSGALVIAAAATLLERVLQDALEQMAGEQGTARPQS